MPFEEVLISGKCFALYPRICRLEFKLVVPVLDKPIQNIFILSNNNPITLWQGSICLGLDNQIIYKVFWI